MGEGGRGRERGGRERERERFSQSAKNGKSIRASTVIASLTSRPLDNTLSCQGAIKTVRPKRCNASAVIRPSLDHGGPRHQRGWSGAANSPCKFLHIIQPSLATFVRPQRQRVLLNSLQCGCGKLMDNLSHTSHSIGAPARIGKADSLPYFPRSTGTGRDGTGGLGGVDGGGPVRR